MVGSPDERRLNRKDLLRAAIDTSAKTLYDKRSYKKIIYPLFIRPVVCDFYMFYFIAYFTTYFIIYFTAYFTTYFIAYFRTYFTA